jgi:hypothetical protein
VTAGTARAAVGLIIVALSPSAARADWLFTPFVGSAFAGSTAVLDLDQGASSPQIVFGGSAGWWSRGVIGFETEFAYAPRFFESALGGLVANSNATTLGANVIVAMPVSVTRESLRPYLVGGLGWMHLAINEGADFFPDLFGPPRNSLGMNIGGGAVGFISPRTGFRFELRQFRSLERDANPVNGERQSLLSFWRASVGVVIRR